MCEKIVYVVDFPENQGKQMVIAYNRRQWLPSVATQPLLITHAQETDRRRQVRPP